MDNNIHGPMDPRLSPNAGCGQATERLMTHNETAMYAEKKRIEEIDRRYQNQINTPDFGWALNQMRLNDRKLFREGWNGKGMWLQIQFPDSCSKMNSPYIYMHTSDNRLVPWVASQSDLLAVDWMIVKE